MTLKSDLTNNNLEESSRANRRELELASATECTYEASSVLCLRYTYTDGHDKDLIHHYQGKRCVKFQSPQFAELSKSIEQPQELLQNTTQE